MALHGWAWTPSASAGRIDTSLLRSQPGAGLQRRDRRRRIDHSPRPLRYRRGSLRLGPPLMAPNYVTGQVITVDDGRTLT
ncbi:hypothetical protein [Actinoallomurus acanthiterrae]